MNFRSNRIYKIRTGHLANFSGGAGYMPFVAFLSIPLSFICTALVNVSLFIGTKRAVNGSFSKNKDLMKYDLNDAIRYMRKFFIWCSIPTMIVAAILFFMGYQMIYDQDKTKYIIPAIILSAGPLISFLASVLILIVLIVKNGLKKTNLLSSYLLYIALLVVFVIIGWGSSI